jgi:hypothetical protein
MADTPSTSLPNPPPGHSTRQLLDELDALMQRMLALPVQDDEPAPDPAADQKPATRSGGQRSVKLMSAPSETVTVQGPPTGKASPVVVAGDVPPFWHAPEAKKSAAARNEFAEQQSAPTYLPKGAEPLLPILLRPEKEGLQAATSPAPAPLKQPVWLKAAVPTAPVVEHYWPKRWLLAINGCFDLATLVFGGAGRWLRGSQGRSMIGWIGLAMIAAAALWALARFLG